MYDTSSNITSGFDYIMNKAYLAKTAATIKCFYGVRAAKNLIKT